MTVRAERRFELPVPREDVWTFISDPGKRAEAISVVGDFELHDPEGRTATWYIDLPIPALRRAARVETEDVTRDPPRHVEFVGHSAMMHVTGSHRLEETEEGCALTNEFVVEGRLPGVERFFERNLDAELDNLEAALREELAIDR